MKARTIILFLTCCLSFSMLAQSDILTDSELYDKEQELKKLIALEQPSKENQVKIFTLCRELGKGYTLKAGTVAGDKVKERLALSKALLFHDLEAKYYYQFGEKNKAEYFKTTLKARACGEAAFVYRDMGKPKSIYIPGWEFENYCGLVGAEEKPGVTETGGETSNNKGGPEYIDEEFEKTLKGKRLYFKTPIQTFSVNIYDPFTLSDQSAIMRDLMKKQYKQALKQANPTAKEESEFDETIDRMHFYIFEKNMGGLILHVEDLNGKDATYLCDEDKKGQLSRWTSVSGIRACMSNVFQNPVTKERLKNGATYVQFEYKGNMVSLIVMAGDGMNKKQHEAIVRAMAKSLRIEGEVELPKIVVKRCKDDSVLQLKQGMPVEWTIIDRSRKSVILYQPALARDADVAASASKFYAAILQVMKWSKDVKQVLNIYNNVVIEKQYRDALLKIGGWAMEDAGTVQIDFVPVEVEDYSNFTADGALTNAAIFYMQALTDITDGLSKLGKTMNKQSMRVYWEIPVITIKGECIPQMVCKNGKWVPDKNNMEFREISRKSHTLRPGNKAFQTFDDIQRDLNKYFYTLLDKAEDAEADYYKVLERCVKSKQQLYKIKFPVNIDQCPVLEQKIQLEQHAMLQKINQQSNLKFELERWLNVLKPSEVASYTRRISLLNEQIQDGEGKLPSLRTIRDNHVKNGDKANAALYTKKIKFLEEDIALLKQMRTSATNNLAAVQSGKWEKEISEELTTVSNQINNHKSKIKGLEAELKICVDEALKVR